MSACTVRSREGFTLIELVVVLLVVSLVMTAASSNFIVQRRAAAVQGAVSEMQMTGQVTLELFERDVRMAGYGVDKGAAVVLQDNAVSSDPLRSPGTDAIQLRYSTSRTSAGGRGGHDYLYYVARGGGLSRRDNKSGTSELIASEVEDLQISQLDDPATGAKQVSLALLLRSRSEDPQYLAVPPVIGNGLAKGADRYRRRVFKAVICPRNYGMGGAP